MKVAVFGGGGLRTPLLLSALSRSGLGFREAALYDPDEKRLAAMLPLLRAAAPGLAVRVAGSPAAAARGSRFVILAIRVGGQRARAADERACLRAGVVGQETVGAAGAALAFRNIPAALDLARTVAREAPDALLVNYANPAGMVSEAIADHAGARVVGVCDTPAALVARVARLAGVAPGSGSVSHPISWSGVNHLGWLTRLYAPAEGAVEEDEPRLPPEDRLGALFREPGRLEAAHPPGLFDPEDYRGAVPSEYVFFALHPDRAVERARAAERTRGEQILALEARLFPALRPATEGAARADAFGIYREVMAERDATYLEIEAGGPASGETAGKPTRPADDSGAFPAPSGYDRIGLAVIRAALAAETGDESPEIVLNARNRTAAGGPAVPELPVEVFVETPARLEPEGAIPTPQPPLPAEAARLLRRVKSCEREITAAAVSGDAGRAAEALREHPAGGPAAAEVFPSLALS